MLLGKSQRDKQPTKVASVAAFNPDGLLLFGKRHDNNSWTLPGGHFEQNEEPIEAAKRELEEETGLKGEDFEFLGVGEVKEGLHIYCFRCQVDGEPDGSEDPDEECSEWRWVEPHDIPDEIMDNLHSKKNITLRLLGIQEGEVEDPLEKKDLLMTKPLPVQHYSTTPGLQTLDPKFQGTGAAGQERNRPKRIPRTYYYTRPGTPEAHVASAAHLYHGELPVGTRLYDMGDDKLNLKAGKWQQTKHGMIYHASDFDQVEKKLKKLGYHGYHNYGTKDAIAYFHPLGVRHVVGKVEDLNKVSLTSESTASRMRPHQPWDTEHYSQIDTYEVGPGIWHHVYYGQPINDRYQSVLHSLSRYENPLHDGLATSAAGVSPSNDPERFGAFDNNPWKDDLPAVTQGEVASVGPKGSGTLLYQNMAKIHGRMISDSDVSAGAEGVWRKLLADPQFKGALGPDKGHRHWLQYDGPKPVPVRSIKGDGRSFKAMMEQPENPYQAEVKPFSIKSPNDYLEVHLYHKDNPNERVGMMGLFVDHGKKRLYGVGPYHQSRGLGISNRMNFGHEEAGGVGLKAAKDATGYTHGGDLPHETAEQYMKKSEDLQKGFLATAALAGTMAMGGASPGVAPHVPEQHQTARPQVSNPVWTPEELHPDLIPIAHLESSFGQNMAHASHSKGEFHTAFGALGLKGSTAHEEYTKSKFMNQKYPGLSAPETFMEKFKNDPKFYNLLASAHFARLKQRHGDPQKAAYAWRWGSTACANASEDQIKNDAYVQKYTAMQLHGKQIQKAEEILSKGEFRSAAFRHKDGTVVETGVFHNIEPWLLGGSMNHRPDGPHNSSDWEAGFVTNGGAFMNRDEAAKHVGLQRYSPVTGQLRNLDSQDPEAGLAKEDPVDTSFDFGANDPAQDHLHQKALKSIARMHPQNQKVAHAWIAFCRGHIDQRPLIHPDLERHLGKFGIVDPKGFPYKEDGRSMERTIGGRKVTRDANGRQTEQPEGLRRYRGLDSDYFKPYQRSEEGEDDLLKSEDDPLEAMLQHDNHRERILALKNKNVTPYHLRMALQDEDPEVRAFAARHPKMTAPMIHEALQHEDINTRKAALSRPDLTPEHIQAVLFDPELQTLAALHPRCTEEQRSMVTDHHLTPPGLKHELLAKTIGFLMYPRLGQKQVPSAPMIRDPEGHTVAATVAGGKEKGPEIAAGKGFTHYLQRPTTKTPGPKRVFSLNVKSGPGLLGTVGHETQHGIFAHLKQNYGMEAGHRIVASTLAALSPDEHDHLKNITGWAVNTYNPTKHPEERITHLQNYLQDQTWRSKAHKSMKILGNRKAEQEAHTKAKQIWQKLRIRAQSLTPQEVGVILKTDTELLNEWVELHKDEVQVEQIVKSDNNIGYNESYEDQLGVKSKFEAFLKAAKFLAHAEPDYGLFRQALLSGLEIDAAALTSVGLPTDNKNKRALLAVVSLQDGKLNKSLQYHKTHEVQALLPDGTEIADAVRRGFSAETEQDLHLGGKHSKGTMMVRDPESGMMFILKPGSGKQSPALGAREEGANQSRREAAFWHVADVLGLGNRVPRADLLLIDGQEVAALHMLPFTWTNLEELKFEDPGLPHKALEKYRHTGELHKWAVLDYVLGQADRHGGNIMVGPQKDGYPVALIDHGSAFAGPSFDPSKDKNSFIPYYLRAGSAQGWGWQKLDTAGKLRAMPSLNKDSDDQLRTWLEGVHGGDLEQVLVRYGIDPQASLDRLVKVRKLLAEPSVSQAINRIWLET